jgi:hypothetical protein
LGVDADSLEVDLFGLTIELHPPRLPDVLRAAQAEGQGNLAEAAARMFLLFQDLGNIVVRQFHVLRQKFSKQWTAHNTFSLSPRVSRPNTVGSYDTAQIERYDTFWVPPNCGLQIVK